MLAEPENQFSFTRAALITRGVQKGNFRWTTNMSLKAFLVSLLIVVLPSSAFCFEETTITIDGKSPGHVFEGIGALSAGASSRLLFDYPEPQRSEILDLLFKPRFAASLHHLKVEIGGDVNSTDGSEPSHAVTRGEFENPKPEYFQRGYEWWLMREAKKRNPKIILETLQWGAPGWIGNGKFYSQDNADFVVSFIKGAKQHHGLVIDYTGVRNENMYDCAWIKLLRKTLDDNQLGNVKIDAADLYKEGKCWGIADDMLKDPALNDCISVVNAHMEGHKNRVPANVRKLNKPIWNGEAHPHGGNWYAAGRLARLNRGYPVGGITKAISWSLITSYADYLVAPHSGPMKANTPWSGHYELQPPLWITAHTAQFAEPGWKYLDGACRVFTDEQGNETGSITALKSPAGRNYSLVVETVDAQTPQTVRFNLAGGLSTKKLAVYRSVFERELFQRLDDIPVHDGQFTVTFEPKAMYSLTTTRGQRKGETHQPIPNDRAFPFPFSADFEDRAIQQPGKFFADQHGTFVVVPRADGKGQCLKQIMPRQGIQWRDYPFPQTIVGDIAWRDYALSVDFMLPGAGTATVWGRFHDLAPNNWGVPNAAYKFEISRDGDWTLKGASSTLASGKAAPLGGSWHTAVMTFVGDRIRLRLDNQVLADVEDPSNHSGLVGLGTGWNEACFDNVRIASP